MTLHTIKKLTDSISDEYNEKELFFRAPELSHTISKLRNRGIPTVYSQIVNKYNVDKFMIFFESALGKQYRGNPKAIYQYMLKKFPEYKFIWCYEGDVSIIPGSPVIVKRASLDYYKYLALSKYVINDTTFPIWSLRDETFFLQTWHGTPLKKLHWDRDKKNDKNRVDAVFYNKSKGWSALISANAYSTDKFRSAFRYTGDIWETGYPSNDIFYDTNTQQIIKESLYKKLKLNKKNKIILYAPTWRDNKHTGNYKFDFDLTFNVENFFKIMGKNTYLLIRMHHMSNIPKIYDKFKGNIIDVSSFDDVNELMVISNLLITDYSSIMFDFSCTKKPFVNYVPDIEQYSQYRGMYFELEDEVPHSLCKTEEELFKLCYNLLQDKEINNNEKYQRFYEKYCHREDGNASKRICHYLFSKK